MDFDYVLADPTGNITVLVRSPYTENNRGDIIDMAFRKEPACEQVGFVMPCGRADICLEMMGYEFCGNATLSAASLKAYEDGLSAGCTTSITVESSGAEEPLSVRISRFQDEDSCPSFEGTLAMPVPSYQEISLMHGGLHASFPIISIGGISHIIADADDFTPGEAEEFVINNAGLLDVPALGIMLCSEPESENDTAEYNVNITPLVYVPGSGTLIWESGCATGSTAVGWYRYLRHGSDCMTNVSQPGGIISIKVTDGVPYLTGRVILRKF